MFLPMVFTEREEDNSQKCVFRDARDTIGPRYKTQVSEQSISRGHAVRGRKVEGMMYLRLSPMQ